VKAASEAAIDKESVKHRRRRIVEDKKEEGERRKDGPPLPLRVLNL